MYLFLALNWVENKTKYIFTNIRSMFSDHYYSTSHIILTNEDKSSGVKCQLALSYKSRQSEDQMWSL